MNSSLALATWNFGAGRLSFAWPETIQAKAPAAKIFDSLEVEIEIDGKVRTFCSFSKAGSSAIAESDGIILKVELTASRSVIARAVNRSKDTCKLDRFVFRASKVEQGSDLLGIPSSRLRIFREGWTMSSAAGSVRFGENDFRVNPEYKSSAVSAPENYCDGQMNRFSGEYVSVLNDSATGISTLVGFITSADQFTRIAISLGPDGISSFEAIADCDGVELAPGEEFSAEEFVVMAGVDGYELLEEFAGLWGARMKAATWSHVPTGWCSWYYYFEKITEQDILENLASLKERKGEFQLEYIQVDDGYESALGDWLVCDVNKFPNGLECLAKEIKNAGFKPGLWLAPFMVEERSELFRHHPDWIIKSRSGEIVWVTTWRGSRVAALDCTVLAAREWLTETFSSLSKMGFEYVKLDFLMYECGAIALGGVYADRKATRAQALRRGLMAIRKGMGDKFILGCTSPLGPEVGLVNGARIGTDITPYWETDDAKVYREAPGVSNVCRNIINRSYMNGRLWINDPDVHIARLDHNKLSEDEVILWTSALWIAGGMLIFGDRFSTLSPARAKLSKMLLHELGQLENARPLDFFDRAHPAIWVARNKSSGGLIIGVFNFEDQTKILKFSLAATGLTSGSAFSAEEFWSGESFNPTSDSVDVELKAHSCKVFILEI